MAVKSKLPPRRQTKVGSRDPICLTCFEVVGGCGPDDRLPEHDKIHVCDSAFLAERGIFTRTETLKRTLSHLPGAAA
ncbi:MAG TPA: hypothetical protein VGN01_19440 [Acidobacteriaceae bacterium]|jgi:hypothetical protein